MESGSGTVVTAELRSIGFNRKELRSEIVIEAPPERVWSILTDFERFPEWNPFIRKISGKIEARGRLSVTLHPSGGRTTAFKPTILKAEPNRELQWIGHIGFPGLFDGQHIFELQPLGDSMTRFVQREQYGGILLPFVSGMLRNETARGFDEMNRALKERAEEGTAGTALPPIT